LVGKGIRRRPDEFVESRDKKAWERTTTMVTMVTMKTIIMRREREEDMEGNENQEIRLTRGREDPDHTTSLLPP
jgi:hypothetical protein